MKELSKFNSLEINLLNIETILILIQKKNTFMFFISLLK